MRRKSNKRERRGDRERQRVSDWVSERAMDKEGEWDLEGIGVRASGEEEACERRLGEGVLGVSGGFFLSTTVPVWTGLIVVVFYCNTSTKKFELITAHTPGSPFCPCRCW
jgi:hypothetical protein